MPDPKPIVLFDLDFTLASLAHHSFGGPPQHILAYPGVDNVLAALQLRCELAVVQAGVEPSLLTGLVQQTGAELGNFFAVSRIFGGEAAEEDVLRAVDAALAPTPTQVKIYVSPSRYRRWFASTLGWRPCPHPRLAAHCLSKDPRLLYSTATMAIAGPSVDASEQLRRLIADVDVVPVDVTHDDGHLVVSVLGCTDAFDQLRNKGLNVSADSREIGDADVVAIQTGAMDAGETLAFDSQLAGISILRNDPGEYVILAPGNPAFVIPKPPRPPHGHLVVRMPALLHATGSTANLALDPRPLDGADYAELIKITGWRLATVHAPLCGNAPLPKGGKSIIGRGIGHNKADNDLIVTHLVDLLKTYVPHGTVELRKFEYGGIVKQDLYNIEATIPGTDSNAGMIILGAHLDSCGDQPCNGVKALASGAEPGADDDASGIAAVLIAAEALGALTSSKLPRREIRFLLFNAEEAGMIGSGAYAANLASHSSSVAAMIQLDMIGWRHPTEPCSFDVHGPAQGWTGAYVYPGSTALINTLVATAADLGFPSAGINQPVGDTGPFHNQNSDHKSFYYNGYAACFVAERGIDDLTQHDPTKSNPAYHSPCDVSIDLQFAADIARIVTATVWRCAKP